MITRYVWESTEDYAKRIAFHPVRSQDSYDKACDYAENVPESYHLYCLNFSEPTLTNIKKIALRSNL